MNATGCNNRFVGLSCSKPASHSGSATMIETTRLLAELVALPSVNPMGRGLQGPDVFEHRVTTHLEEFFRGLGVRFERQAVAPLRENIVARFESPAPRRTIIFEAHQDTVPTDYMTIDPYGAR